MDFIPQKEFRVALIYDDTVRPDTTGTYCLKALQQICSVTHILPTQLGSVYKEQYDLFLHIDDGFDYVIPSTLYPKAWWVIDTHLNLQRDVERSNFYDWVFVGQRDGAQAMSHQGIINVWWLPLAGDPTMAVSDAALQYDWSFVGNVNGPLFSGRHELLSAIQGTGRSYVGQAPPSEMYKIYKGSKAVINPPIRNDINMRVFETMMAGSILITQRLSDNGMDVLFEEGIQYLGYDTVEEAMHQLRRVMEMPESERLSIVSAAQKTATDRDSYWHRMAALLQVVWTTPGIQAQYFRHVRQEVLALVPQTASTVLDIGCATGKLGESIKNRQTCEVYGIEMNPSAAHEAAKLLDKVLIGTAETQILEFPDESFSCIILADILEHLMDPWQFLHLCAKKLQKNADACIIISIPNVSHWSVVVPLLQGQWQYMDAGILDATHLRFFTPQSVARMVQGAGLSLKATQGVVLPVPLNVDLGESALVQQWMHNLASIYQMLCVCVWTDAY